MFAYILKPRFFYVFDSNYDGAMVYVARKLAVADDLVFAAYVRLDEPCVYHRIDETLTMVLDMENREPIGFRLKGFKNFYLRKLKPSMKQLDDGNFVFLVTIIERLVAEMGDRRFQQDEERKTAYAKTWRERIGSNCMTFPRSLKRHPTPRTPPMRP